MTLEEAELIELQWCVNKVIDAQRGNIDVPLSMAIDHLTYTPFLTPEMYTEAVFLLQAK